MNKRFRAISKRILSAIVFAVSVIFVVTLALVMPNLYSNSAIFASGCATSGSDLPFARDLAELFVRQGISGAFLVSKNGNIMARGFCGTSDPSQRSPVTAETKFNIGSLTKQFTGFMVFELQREGRLNLDDRLSLYVPELADRAMGKVTIGQLISMRGGIPYILPLKDFLVLQMSRRIRSQKEMIAQIGALDLIHTPGEQFEYSNLGYSLLGIVVSRIDHQSWSESLKQRIFVPARMLHSTTEGEVSDRPAGLAAGLIPFRIFSGTWFIALPHWNYSMIKGAGGIVSTVEDLHRWNDVLTETAKREPDLAKLYFPTGQASDDNYRFGWFRSKTKLSNGRSVETLSHGGEDPGYCSTNIRLLDSDAHLVLTTNSDHCFLKDGPYRDVIRRMLDRLSEVT